MIAATYVSVTTFTVSGDQTAEFHVGRRVKHVGDTTGYGTIESVTIPVADTQVVLTTASDDMDNTLSGVYYGVVSSYEPESSVPIHTHDGDEGSGGGIKGDQNLEDKLLQRANFKDCGIITQIIGSIGGGAQAISIVNGQNVTATVDTGETTFTFTNATASDDLCVFALWLTNGGSQTINFPTVHTNEGEALPTLTTSGLDMLVFGTYNGGTSWVLVNYLLDIQAPA